MFGPRRLLPLHHQDDAYDMGGVCVMAMYNNSGSSGLDADKTGGEVRYCLRFWSARSASGVHSKRPDFLRSLKMGRPRWPSLEMNLPKAAVWPKKRCTSLGAPAAASDQWQ